MNLLGILTLIGGLALFLYGMDVMGKGLTNLSGGRMEALLARLTSNRLKAVLLGLAVTAVIQSSSATTVMVVGFVNSGIMELSQAAGVIMGANIGTTITAWLMSLAGIESESLFMQLLKPTYFSPVLAAIGVVLVLFCKNKKKNDSGTILVGFAVLMYGMEAMSGAVEPLADNKTFTSLMTAFTNPILGVIAGAVLTGIIQSSSASVGILQALCMTGSVPYAVAIPVIMGQNIGTCVTALISSIGASKNAKRAAMIHLYFNLIGVTIFMSVFYILHMFISFDFLDDMATASGIAIFHSLFNVTVTIILFPFLDKLVKLAIILVKDNETLEDTKDKDEDKDFALLDERFLSKPSVAVMQGKDVLLSMADKAMESASIALDLFDKFDDKKASKIIDLENKTDKYEDKLGTYLVRVSEKELSASDSEKVSLYLQNIGDLERISDHALNIEQSFKEMKDKNLEFSIEAKREIGILISAVKEITKITLSALITNDKEMLSNVEPLEQVIDKLTKETREHHINRLRDGICTIELGYILADITTNLERISDHCSNLASSNINIASGGYDTHEYLTNYKKDDNEEFVQKYKIMDARFHL